MRSFTPRLRAWLAAAAAALALGGCGGGIFIGGEFGDDDPPRVSLGPVPPTLPGGGTVTLTASASDDSGYVEQVDFFIVLGGRRQFLAADLSRPYEVTVTLPEVSAPTHAQIIARAYDGWGQRRDSAPATVTLLP